MATKLFGGLNLSDVARDVKARPDPPAADRASNPRVVLPSAELALSGRSAPDLERENIFSVDPKRTRPWKHHNRLESWYTQERCRDLIESIVKSEQQEPAVARRLKGDPDYDYEIIYGMRRRFACETLGKKLKLRVVDVDDERAAILMHIENADRQDITAMERALSFQELLDEKVFATQERLGEGMNLSKGQISKMLKAASFVRLPAIGVLFADKSAIPVDQAYKVATLLDRTGAKEVILQAAKNIVREGQGRGPAEVLRVLIGSLDRTKKFQPLQKRYNLGPARHVIATRNAKGKVTLSFAEGLQGASKDDIVKVIEAICQDLT